MRDYKEGKEFHLFKHIQVHGPNIEELDFVQKVRNIDEDESSNPLDPGATNSLEEDVFHDLSPVNQANKNMVLEGSSSATA